MNPSDEHSDTVFYDIVAKEIQSAQIDTGLMAKALTKSAGDKKQAELLYVEWRVKLLEEQTVTAVVEKRKQERSNFVNEFGLYIIILIILSIIIYFLAF